MPKFMFGVSIHLFKGKITYIFLYSKRFRKDFYQKVNKHKTLFDNR